MTNRLRRYRASVLYRPKVLTGILCGLLAGAGVANFRWRKLSCGGTSDYAPLGILQANRLRFSRPRPPFLVQPVALTAWLSGPDHLRQADRGRLRGQP